MSAIDERQAFHAAVWRTPDDDLPRLVYADWLDEHNEHDAAAFLRLLCAVRTCPPDVDRLRPLVADFRRAMVKLPAKWIDDVCPVPPAVVVGPWVDVDHEANARVLAYLGQRRRARTGLPSAALSPVRPGTECIWADRWVIDKLWGELQEALSPGAACAIDGVPALVDVWGGVVMATAVGEGSYAVRVPAAVAATPAPVSFNRYVSDWFRNRVDPADLLGDDWRTAYDSIVVEARWLRQAAAEFDPANRPA